MISFFFNRKNKGPNIDIIRLKTREICHNKIKIEQGNNEYEK